MGTQEKLKSEYPTVIEHTPGVSAAREEPIRLGERRRCGGGGAVSK